MEVANLTQYTRPQLAFLNRRAHHPGVLHAFKKQPETKSLRHISIFIHVFRIIIERFLITAANKAISLIKASLQLLFIEVFYD